MLFVWGPAGILLFGVGGARVLHRKWGLTDPDVLTGIGIGAGLVLLLAAIVAWRWNHRLTAAEVAEAHGAYAEQKRSGAASSWAWGTGAAGSCTGACAVIAGSAGLLAFLFTLMTLATVLAWIVALGRRGLYQRT
jgi:hypothetical protein